MKNLKLRVWDSKINEWVSSWDGSSASIEVDLTDDSIWISWNSLFCDCCPEGCGGCKDKYQKEPQGNRFIVEQFIGRYDKNKREIFEGDICRFWTPDRKEFRLQPIVYNDIIACYTCGNEENVARCEELEIMGNIHEMGKLTNG